MATFVLIPGAGGNGSYWDGVVSCLTAAGHTARAVDIREDDPLLGLPEYAAQVRDVIGDATDVVLVAQSLGGFTAPMVSAQVQMIVLVNAMIPEPGEKPGDWWGNTGAVEAREQADRDAGRSTDFDLTTHFLHDIADDVRQQMVEEGPRNPSDTPFGQPCLFDAWPHVPIHVVAGADDRFFPLAFQQRVARERLGIEPDVIAGGHLVAKSNPNAVTERLVGYLADADADH